MKDSDFPECYTIRLHCYLLGPHRHYEWTENTLLEAVNRAKQDIDKWISEEV